ncbi:MAG: protein-L-isoaspartate O-methyltransferase [Rhodospirillaceae bacterium]|nr:protein-L-isoaspartate O-methyltransferase [Rhodospirillaceae bacterium]
MDFAAARHNMVVSQIKTNRVTDPLVIEAMEAVPREKFLAPEQRQFAYVDEDLPIGKGRVIMEPMVLARLLQLADIQTTDSALLIGAGTGYSTAVLARMASSVVAVESEPDLVAWAAKVLTELSVDNAAVVSGEPTRGKPEQGPFDVIFINGAVSSVPEALKNQLADGGRLVAIVAEGPVGRATLITRSGNAFGHRTEFDAATPVLPGFQKQPGFVF